jgi:hypothetical protein
MKMRKVYIVQGMTGEYDDARSWNVRVFTHLGKAKAFIRKLEKELAESISRNEVDLTQPYWDQNLDKVAIEMRETIDPKFQIDYTGTSYFHSVSEGDF